MRSRLALTCCLLVLAACPIGCPKGKPQTLFAGPYEQIAVEKTGRCSFRIVGSMEGRPYPHSDDGFYGILLDTYAASHAWTRYDPETRTITVLDRWCHDGIVLELVYQSFVRTVNEP